MIIFMNIIVAPVVSLVTNNPVPVVEESVEITCTVVGYPPVTSLSWYTDRSGSLERLTDTDRVTISPTMTYVNPIEGIATSISTLGIEDLRVSDTGAYMCAVSSNFSATSNETITLAVYCKLLAHSLTHSLCF